MRTMDHAFRMLILIESLTLVKRMIATSSEGQAGNRASQRAKQAISNSIEKLKASIQIDVNQVLKTMLSETDEVKQAKNIDLIFRVCIPLYFLQDVKNRNGEETETIKDILMSAQYQLLINQRLGPSARSVTLNNIFARFISNPNDSNNNRELRNIERLFNENSDDLNESVATGESQNPIQAKAASEISPSYASQMS